MTGQGTGRLLFVHAHPDDETINNGATIAHYAAAGAEVCVLTCTLGEEGEVIGSRWAQLAVDGADQLGGYRIAELAAALRALGVAGPRFLGGAGRWRDSGMAGTPPRRRTRFVDADIDEAVAEMAEVIAELRPHVVVTYDPGGGYGHPDHIQAHRVTTGALAAAGARWRVPKFYWTVTSASAVRAAIGTLAAADVGDDWIWPSDGAPAGFPDEKITTVIDARAHLGAKTAALRAHATQITLGPTGRAFTLSNRVILPVLGRERYVLAAGVPAAGDHGGGPETDLLAGLDLTT